MKSVHSRTYRHVVGELRRARKERGLTQQQLADRLGRPQSFVAKVENGERRIDVAEFIEFARAVGTDPLVLFTRLLAK